MSVNRKQHIQITSLTSFDIFLENIDWYVFLFTLQILQITLSPCCDKFYVKGLWKSTHRTWHVHRLNSFALPPARLSLIVMTKVKSVTQPPSLWVKKTKTWWSNKKIKQSTFLKPSLPSTQTCKSNLRTEFTTPERSTNNTFFFLFSFFFPPR